MEENLWASAKWNESNFSKESVEKISTSLLKFLSPISILYIIVGALSTVTSALTLATIACNRNLHTRSYLLYLLSSISNTLIGAHLTARGCLRFIYYIWKWPLVLTERQCMHREAPILFAIAFGYVIFIIAAIDRLVSSVRPVWYLTKNHNCIFCIPIFVGLLYVSAEISVLIVGSSKVNLIPICSFGLTTDKTLIVGSNYRIQMSFCIVLILFAWNIIYIRIQLISSRRRGLNVSHTRKRLQVKITRTLIIMLISFMCTIWAAHVVHLIAESMTNLENEMIAASFSAILLSLNGVANLILMTCRCEEFKSGLVKCFLCICFKRNPDRKFSTRTQSVRLISLNSLHRTSFAFESAGH